MHGAEGMVCASMQYRQGLGTVWRFAKCRGTVDRLNSDGYKRPVMLCDTSGAIKRARRVGEI